MASVSAARDKFQLGGNSHNAPDRGLVSPLSPLQVSQDPTRSRLVPHGQDRGQTNGLCGSPSPSARRGSSCNRYCECNHVSVITEYRRHLGLCITLSLINKCYVVAIE